MPETRERVGDAAGAGEAPALSVILVAAGGYDTIRKVVGHLRAQTARERIELVLVAPSRGAIAPIDALVAAFSAVRVVEVGPIRAKDQAAADGVRAAAAPVVALVEDHAYPAPDWAAAIIEAHRGPWVAVGPALGNANPASTFSWANLLLAYGRWCEPGQGRVVDDVPVHNGSFKRDALLRYGADLGRLLEREGGLTRALAADGGCFYLEAAARIDHVNVSRPAAALALRFHAERAYAATRAREGRWSPARRLAYLAGTPLLPLLRLRYIWPFLRRADQAHHLLPRLWPALGLLLLAHTAGAASGYAMGIGNAVQRLADFEFDRTRYLTARDRRAEAG